MLISRLHSALWNAVIRHSRIRRSAMGPNAFIAGAALWMPLSTIYAIHYEWIIFKILILRPHDADRAIAYWNSLWRSHDDII